MKKDKRFLSIFISVAITLSCLLSAFVIPAGADGITAEQAAVSAAYETAAVQPKVVVITSYAGGTSETTSTAVSATKTSVSTTAQTTAPAIPETTEKTTVTTVSAAESTAEQAISTSIIVVSIVPVSSTAVTTTPVRTSLTLMYNIGGATVYPNQTVTLPFEIEDMYGRSCIELTPDIPTSSIRLLSVKKSDGEEFERKSSDSDTYYITEKSGYFEYEIGDAYAGKYYINYSAPNVYADDDTTYYSNYFFREPIEVLAAPVTTASAVTAIQETTSSKASPAVSTPQTTNSAASPENGTSAISAVSPQRVTYVSVVTSIPSPPVSIAGWYFTSVNFMASVDNADVGTPGTKVSVKLTCDNSVEDVELKVVPDLLDGITLIKASSSQGDEYELSSDGSFTMNGGMADLVLNIDESAADGTYKVNFKITGDKNVDTSTASVFSGIHYQYWCDETSGGIISVGEPAVTGVTSYTVTSDTGINTSATMVSTLPVISLYTTMTFPQTASQLCAVYVSVSDVSVPEETSDIVKVPFSIGCSYTGVHIIITAPEGMKVLSVKNNDGEEFEYSEYSYGTEYRLTESEGYIELTVDSDIAPGEYQLKFSGSLSSETQRYEDVVITIFYQVMFSGGKITVTENPDVTTAVTSTTDTPDITTTSTTVSQVTSASTDSTASQTDITSPATTTSPDTTTQNVSGDANGDGKLDVRDAAYIASALAKSGETENLSVDAMDFNGDGVVNVRDAAAIARYLAYEKK
ncbi:MAG: dockerin type I repeat-containing protein [Porcipelethomonas sp.]